MLHVRKKIPTLVGLQNKGHPQLPIMPTIFEYFDNPWIYWALTVSYTITVLCVVAIIVSENRNPLKSLAWVTVLTLLPAVGIVLYIFFGRNIKNKHIISRRRKRHLRSLGGVKALPVSLPGDLNAESRQQIRLARSIGDAPFFPGNEITIYNNGADKFDALLADLRAATTYIHLQYYIFNDDTIGNIVADTLIERARAGVKVRVIYDHIGSLHTSSRFFKRMRSGGVEIHPFFRVVFPLLGSRINWRNHRKLCVIDGRVGYIGGMNIADRYVAQPDAHHRLWRDIHLRLTGPAIAALQYSFAIDWSTTGNQLLSEQAAEVPTSASMPGAGVQMLTSGPTSQWSEIAFAFFKAIGNARHRIFIQTPYFLPTEALLKSLQAAALSKVDVRLMIPSHSDSWLLTAASRSYISECQRAGIKIYFFEPGMLHSKTLIVDDELCSIGSTNFDFRSFEHNFEGNLFVYSQEFNREMTTQFREDMKLSRRITPAEWRRRPFWRKAVESTVRLLSPIL